MHDKWMYMYKVIKGDENGEMNGRGYGSMDNLGQIALCMGVI